MLIKGWWISGTFWRSARSFFDRIASPVQSSSPVPAYAISPTTNGDCSSTTSHPSTREEAADGRTVSILLRKYLSIHREGAERWWWWCIEGWSGMPNERHRRRGWTSVWLTNPVVVQWKRVGYISASVVGQKVHFQSGYPLFRVTQRNLRNNNSSLYIFGKRSNWTRTKLNTLSAC